MTGTLTDADILAEEIEALRGDVNRANEALAAVTAERDALRAANDAYVYLGVDGRATTGRALEDRALAAEAESAALRKALESEREECAQLAVDLANSKTDLRLYSQRKMAAEIAAAIRARAVLKEQTHAE